MSAASQTDGRAPAADGRAPAAQRDELTDNRDPNEPLKNYFKVKDTSYLAEFERDVPGRGTLRFNLFQAIREREDGQKYVWTLVECQDLNWRQFDDTRLRVLIRRAGCEDSFAANRLLGPDNGEMLGVPSFALSHTDSVPLPLYCWIEECDIDVCWNALRQTHTFHFHHAPDEFGGLAGRFVLQSAVDEQMYYVHYFVLADCSPVLKRCMDANIDQIAEGVPFKLQYRCVVIGKLLELVYLKDARRVEDNICGVIELAQFLEMFGMVRQLMQIMREQLNNKSFERLFDWFECAAKFDLDDNQLEVAIFKRLVVLAGDDQEKKDVLKDQMKEYMKKNPDKVAELAIDGLFK